MKEDYIPKKWWTEEENKIFIERYPHYTNEELVEIFYSSNSIKSLCDKAFLLKVTKSDETRKRIHIMQSELFGIDSPIYGIVRSDETREKISIARKGKNVGTDNYWFGKKRSFEQRMYLSKIKKSSGQWKGVNNPRHVYPLFGENNGRWQGGITSINEKIRNSEEYLNWKLSVFKRDEYICQCCGNGKESILHAHHIENFSTNEDIRFDINNGITLCKSCHDPAIKGSFHNTYGTRNNNLEQLMVFIKNHKDKSLEVVN